jgi:cysteine synthase A
MAKIYTSAEQLIGNTPLLELTHFEKKLGLKAKVFAKLEFYNPAGSIKDRIAKSIIEDAEASGRLKPGATIIEPTSGNTGIGISALAVLKGYKSIIVMPDSLSVERKRILMSYGTQLVITPASEGMKGALDKAEELSKTIPNSIIAWQFSNPANPKAHFDTTGPEIWRDTDGKVDVFISGVGTGGTITGAGQYLKSKNPNIRIVAVEPASSAFLATGKSGKHLIQGIGAGFKPDVLDTTIFREIATVSDEEAYEMTRSIVKTEGIFAGISSGAACAAALEMATYKENENKNIVVIFPDSGHRYLSTPGLFGV